MESYGREGRGIGKWNAVQARGKSERNEGRRSGEREKYLRKGLGVEGGERSEGKSKEGREGKKGG